MVELSALDKKFIFLLSGDMGDGLTPYADLAAKAGVSEEEFLAAVRRFQDQGLIRRLGATLWHQKSGFAANAMVVFKVGPDKAEATGLALAGLSYVSHCYLRRTAPNWPFNLYVMVHAENREKLMAIVEEMTALAKAEQWQMLESLKELKKSSRRYFSGGAQAARPTPIGCGGGQEA